MNTPAPIHAWPDVTVAHLHADTPAQVGAPQLEAANDPAQAEPEANDPRNPLWYLAVAGACVFAAMAALLALG